MSHREGQHGAVRISGDDVLRGDRGRNRGRLIVPGLPRHQHLLRHGDGPGSRSSGQVQEGARQQKHCQHAPQPALPAGGEAPVPQGRSQRQRQHHRPNDGGGPKQVEKQLPVHRPSFQFSKNRRSSARSPSSMDFPAYKAATRPVTELPYSFSSMVRPSCCW